MVGDFVLALDVLARDLRLVLRADFVDVLGLALALAFLLFFNVVFRPARAADFLPVFFTDFLRFFLAIARPPRLYGARSTESSRTE